MSSLFADEEMNDRFVKAIEKFIDAYAEKVKWEIEKEKEWQAENIKIMQGKS